LTGRQKTGWMISGKLSSTKREPKVKYQRYYRPLWMKKQWKL
jgi:hypothetical protein